MAKGKAISCSPTFSTPVREDHFILLRMQDSTSFLSFSSSETFCLLVFFIAGASFHWSIGAWLL